MQRFLKDCYAKEARNLTGPECLRGRVRFSDAAAASGHHLKDQGAKGI
jgi:hypothetical protein